MCSTDPRRFDRCICQLPQWGHVFGFVIKRNVIEYSTMSWATLRRRQASLCKSPVVGVSNVNYISDQADAEDRCRCDQDGYHVSPWPV